LVEIGKRIEAIEKPKGEGRKSPGTNQHNEVTEKFSATDIGRAADKAASAVGMSRLTYEKAKAVVAAASKPDAPPQGYRRRWGHSARPVLPIRPLLAARGAG
jgi:hypothetical protein